MNFYQDCYIWHDGDYATRNIVRVDAPFIVRLDVERNTRIGTYVARKHVLPESRARFRLSANKVHWITEDIEVQLCSDDMIWRQLWGDDGWSPWHGVRYDPKVFREPQPLMTLWDRLLASP